jgi:chromosome segregation ATPase
MGFWERLIGAGSAEEKDPRRLLPELLASYREEYRLAQQIREHANRAPHQAGARQLRAIADEQDRVVQMLRDELAALNGEVQGAVGPIKEGKNHWARVVQDLEDSQALRQHYNEQAIFWEPDFPRTVTLYRMLEREKSRINTLLRDVAIRADPHALD